MDEVPSLVGVILSSEDEDKTIRRLPLNDARLFVDVIYKVCSAFIQLETT